MLPWLEERGIELFRSEARLDGERRVIAGDDVLTARKAVIIATGTTASLPPIPGLAEADPWTNREGTTVQRGAREPDRDRRRPRRLRARTGVELARTPTWCSSKPRPASSLQRRSSPARSSPKRFADARRRRPRAASRSRTSPARTGASTSPSSGEETMEAEQLMVAAGRQAATRTGSASKRSASRRASGSTSTISSASTDTTGSLPSATSTSARCSRTPASTRRGSRARRSWAATRRRQGRHGGPPRVTFTDPQIAAVGLTSEQAAEKGIDVETVDVSTSGNAGASFHGRNTPGTSRIVIDKERGVIVGATFVGYQTAELLHSATIAIAGEVPVEKLVEAIPAFPTRTEIWLRLLEAYGLSRLALNVRELPKGGGDDVGESCRRSRARDSSSGRRGSRAGTPRSSRARRVT